MLKKKCGCPLISFVKGGACLNLAGQMMAEGIVFCKVMGKFLEAAQLAFRRKTIGEGSGKVSVHGW